MPRRGHQERDLGGVCHVVVVGTAQQVSTVRTVPLVEAMTSVGVVALVETVTGEECEDIICRRICVITHLSDISHTEILSGLQFKKSGLYPTRSDCKQVVTIG